jgi:hypothetical protein
MYVNDDRSVMDASEAREAPVSRAMVSIVTRGEMETGFSRQVRVRGAEVSRCERSVTPVTFVGERDVF